MSENDKKKPLSGNETKASALEKNTNIENLTEDFEVLRVPLAEIIEEEKSADEMLKFKENLEDITSPDDESSIFTAENKNDSLIEKSPIFKELSEPKLPALSKENNRARLQMQSPNRLFFYWSIKNNPFQTLNRVFGNSANSYKLMAKLVNRTQNREEIYPIEAEGSAWFDVDANSSYRTEIGFYAENRPFVRLMFSNTIVTPRKNPSPRQDFSADWAVSANQFAQILDVSGYPHDAVEVALAGDDTDFADNAAQNAFSQVLGNQKNELNDYDTSEMRFVLLALASGYPLENLYGQISKSLFAKLQENAEKLSAKNAFSALQQHFGEFADETIEEGIGQTVFGISSINFPRFSKRKALPKFAPLSSFR